MNRAFLICFLFIVCLTSWAGPNVILIVADDYGADACFPYGCDTNVAPNIDSLATDGMMFMNMNSASSCGPSRGMFMTGRITARNGVGGVVNANLSTNEVAITRIISDAGIATGIFGKWNLYYEPTASTQGFTNQTQQLEFHGYDTNLTFVGPTIDYGDPATQETYAPYQYNQAALQFIDAHADEQFFMSYNFGLVHAPLSPTPFDPTFTGTDEEMMWLMVEYMDWCVSNIIDKVESLGIASNTVILFMGDNGTTSAVTVSFDGAPVTGGKLTTDENAFWVPFYAKWPGVINAGSTNSDYWSFPDVATTVIEMLGLHMPIDRIIDGSSFYGNILGTSDLTYREVTMSVHQGSGGTSRNGDRKILDTVGVFTLYDTSNRPFGDIEITDKTQYDITAELWLINAYSNMIYKSFGDRPWGGSTNEYIFSEE